MIAQNLRSSRTLDQNWFSNLVRPGPSRLGKWGLFGFPLLFALLLSMLPLRQSLQVLLLAFDALTWLSTFHRFGISMLVNTHHSILYDFGKIGKGEEKGSNHRPLSRPPRLVQAEIIPFIS